MVWTDPVEREIHFYEETLAELPTITEPGMNISVVMPNVLLQGQFSIYSADPVENEL